MLPIVSAYHDILVFGKTPAMEPMLITFAVAAVLLLVSLFMFRRAAPEMVDTL